MNDATKMNDTTSHMRPVKLIKKCQVTFRIVDANEVEVAVLVNEDEAEELVKEINDECDK